MVKIIITNVRSKIEGNLDSEILKKLDKAQSYYVDGHAFSPRFRMHRWDGKIHLFSKTTQVFQTGCFFIVVKILKQHNISYEVIDQRKVILPETPLKVYCKQPRDYQEEAIEALLKVSRGVLLAATGSGKTFIVTNVVARLNLPTVIYVHTCDLLHQMRDEIENLLHIKCGQLGDGIVNIKKINVATMQTVSRAILGKYEKLDEEDYADDEYTNIEPYKEQIIEMVKNCNVVIIDETHHASAGSIQTIMKTSENAYFRYGVTGTLREKDDDLLIYAVIGRVVHKIGASDLIRKKWLVRPIIYFYEVEYDLKQQAGSYQQMYKRCIVENKYRNRLITDSALKFYKAGKKILILVRQINHGEILTRELLKDMKVRFLQSKVNSDIRKIILKDFREGRLDCIVATSLAWEESILIRKNGYVRHIEIGKFVDQYLEKEGVKNIEGIETLTIDKERKTTWKLIQAVVKHKRQNNILQVTTERGQEVRVTENHSLIGENEEKVKPEVGNKVLIATEFELPQNIIELDLVQEFAKKLPIEEKERVRLELYGENLSQAKRRLMKSEWRYLTNQKIDSSTKCAVRKRLKIYNYDLEEYKEFLDWFWQYIEYKRGRSETSQYSCSIKDAAKCTVNIEKFCNARIYYHRSRTVVFLPLKLKVTNELVRLLGYYVSEGSKGEYGERIGWKITLAASDYTEKKVKDKYTDNSKHNQMMRWKAEIRTDMKRCFEAVFNAGISEEKVGICVNNKLTYFLFTYVLECKELAEHKDIPALIFNVSTELKWEFINAYMRGDGNYNQKYNEIMFASCSYKLICGLSLLLRSLNCTQIRIHRRPKENNFRANFDLYCLYCNDSDYQGPIPELLEIRSKPKVYSVVQIKKTIKIESCNSQFVYDICIPEVERFICGSGICASNTLADEGLDLPILDAVILAGSGKSKIKAFQRIGRAIRPFPSAENNTKEKAYIVDFMDKAHYLEDHSKERLKIYLTEEEFEVKIQKK